MSDQAQTNALRGQPDPGHYVQVIAMTCANPEPRLHPVIIVERRS